jgi:hypothetical protein
LISIFVTIGQSKTFKFTEIFFVRKYDYSSEKSVMTNKTQVLSIRRFCYFLFFLNFHLQNRSTLTLSNRQGRNPNPNPTLKHLLLFVSLKFFDSFGRFAVRAFKFRAIFLDYLRVLGSNFITGQGM